MIWNYFYVFLQSNFLEVPIYYFFFLSQMSIGPTTARVTAINSLTHPIVFFVIMNLKRTYLENILWAETFAILSESLFFALVYKVGWAPSLMASLIANLVSWQLAPILTFTILRFF